MYEQKRTSAPEGQQAGEVTQPSSSSAPTMYRGPLSEWGSRHVRGVAFIRLAVAIWLVCLGTVFCVLGEWWGALLFAAAALVGWLAYRGFRSQAGRR